MYYLFVILILIASLLMIGIVLIQESKGGGLSSQFNAGNQLAGVRKTTDFIEKATWGLAIAMVQGTERPQRMSGLRRSGGSFR